MYLVARGPRRRAHRSSTCGRASCPAMCLNLVICSISCVKSCEFQQLPPSPRASFEDVLESIVNCSISSVRRNTSQSDQTGKYCLLTAEMLLFTMDSSTSPKLDLGLSGNCWNSKISHEHSLDDVQPDDLSHHTIGDARLSHEPQT